MSPFLNELDPNVFIYRVFSRNRFLEVLENRQLTLVKPKLWDDPYENFMEKQRVRLGATGTIVSIEAMMRDYFGQCWTLKEESDAIWRIYSPNKDGVKVRTTPRKLLRAICPSYDDPTNIFFRIGRVMYPNVEELVAFLSDEERLTPTLLDSTGEGQMQLLLVKRPEFEHEHEVRVLCHDSSRAAGDVRSFPIDPKGLFEEVVLDPRMHESDVRCMQRDLSELASHLQPRQSHLYQPPDFGVLNVDVG